MGAGDVEKGLAWLDDRFHVIRYEDDELPSVDWVLDLARAAVLRWVVPFFISASASAPLDRLNGSSAHATAVDHVASRGAPVMSSVDWVPNMFPAAVL